MAIAVPTRIGLGTTDIGDMEIALVSDCLRSGMVSPGLYQERFERKVADFHGMQYGAFVNSGQSALHLSLLAWQLRRYPIKRILVPAVTYISTLHAVWNAGLEVALCDVDPVDWLLDVASADNERYEGAIPVDLFGKAWQSDGRGNISCLIEDACEAIGAPGTGYGDTMCLSFYASHSITTGCGGMVLTNDEQLWKYVKRLANHGRTVVPAGDSLDQSRQFVFDREGFSFKNSDLNAALGLAQIDRLGEILSRRRRVGLLLLSRLRHHAELQLADANHHTFQMFPIVCREARFKEPLVEHLNEAGIETRDTMPIVTQPVVKERLGVRTGQFPVADYLAERGFYIGCHQHISDDEVDYIAGVFDAFFGG